MPRAGGRAFQTAGTTRAKAPGSMCRGRGLIQEAVDGDHVGPGGTDHHKGVAFILNEVEAIGWFQAKGGCDLYLFKQDPSGCHVENRL